MIKEKIHVEIFYFVYKVFSILAFAIIIVSIFYNIYHKLYERVILFSIVSFVLLIAMILINFIVYKVIIYSEKIIVGNFYFGKKTFNKNDLEKLSLKREGSMVSTYEIKFKGNSKKYKFSSNNWILSDGKIKKMFSNNIN